MDTEYKSKRAETFRALLLIFAAIFLCKGTLYVIIDDLEATLPGVSKIGVGAAMAAYLGVLTLSTLIFGYYGEKLSEKYSRKKIFTITQFGWVICYGLIVFSVNYLHYLILTICAAFFVGAYIPLAFTMVGEFYPPEERGGQYGWLNLGVLIGIGGGMIFGSLWTLFGDIGWRLAYVLGFGLGFAAVLNYHIVGIEPERGREEPEFQDLKTIKYDYKITLSKLKRLFRNRTLAALLISMLIQGIAIETLGVWTPYYFEFDRFAVLGANAGLFALLFIILAGLGGLAGNIFGGKRGDKYYNEGKLKKRVIISLGGLIIGLACIFGYYFLPFNSGSVLQIVLSSILILGIGLVSYFLLAFPAGNQIAIYSEVCVPEVRSTANAMHGVMLNLGGVFGNVLLPAIIQVDIDLMAFAISICLIFQLIGALFWIIPYFTYPREAEECRDVMRARLVEMKMKVEE